MTPTPSRPQPSLLAPNEALPPLEPASRGPRAWASILLVGTGSLAFWMGMAPAPPGDPLPHEFHENRARQHLEAVAAAPRVAGTEAHAASREHIVATLERLGFEVEVQSGLGLLTRGRATLAGEVQNIVAYLPATHPPSAGGPAPGDVLLMSHYDSVEQGPGAGDAGAGVAAALEIARALREGPTLSRGIRILLTDGEENGLLGATSFLREHPGATSIAVVVNLEARGGSGPAVMFETSAGNRPLVRTLAQAAHHGGAALPKPNASSFYVAFYRSLPNDTDLTPFLEAGMPGMNLAFFFDTDVYHSRSDVPERVDPASLNHLGSQGLAAVRALAQSPDTVFVDSGGEDHVFFTLAGRFMVWPNWGVLLVLLAGLTAVAVALVVQRREGSWGWERVPLSMAALPIQLAASTVVALLIWTGLSARLEETLQPWDTPPTLLLWSGGALMAAAASLVAQTWLRGKVGWLPLWTGTALGLLVLAIPALALLPGGAYLIAFPGAAMAVAAAGVALLLPRTAPSRTPWLLLLAGLLPAACVLLLWMPLLNGIPRILGNHTPAWLFLGLVSGLLVSVCFPLLAPVGGRHGWRLPVLLAGLAFLPIIQGVRGSEWTRETPLRSHIDYAVNQNSQQGALLSLSAVPNPWAAGVLGPEVRRSPIPGFLGGTSAVTALWADAPFLELDSLGITMVSSQDRVGGRTLRLVLTPPEGARNITLRLPGSVILDEVRVQGVPWGREPGQAVPGADWTVRYFVLPGETVEVELDVAGREPTTVYLQHRLPGLPATLSVPPRPDWILEDYRPDGTLVNRTLVL
ncbi:MAG: M28 family peptidase [Gemmatimonadota bacterium]